MSIEIIFDDMERPLIMQVSLDNTVRDTLLKYLEMTNSSQDLSMDKISFMYNALCLNREQNLNKKLSDLKIRNRAKIRIIKTS